MKTLPKMAPPVKGTVKVLRPAGAVGDVGEVAINGRPYFLAVGETCYTLCGFDARKGEVTAYDLDAALSSCDCPDATFRPRAGGCKHRKALAALRGVGKLPDLPAVPDLAEGASYKPGHSGDLPF